MLPACSSDSSCILPDYGYFKGNFSGSIICINDSLLQVAKNIKLFQPNMILMVPLMIETMAKKLEDAAGLPAEVVKREVFG